MSASPATGVRATYRVQLHAGFPLGDAARLTPYLARLGVSHVYASPILRARAGSAHGYDVVDPGAIDPERGGSAGLDELHAALRRLGMGLVLDIVPNHMGIGAENPYWDDLLTHGRASRFARWFDVDWAGGGDRLVLPILGAPLREELAAGRLAGAYDPLRGFRVRYFEHDLPLDPATASGLVARAARRLADGRALRPIAAELAALPPRLPTAGDRHARATGALVRLAAVIAGRRDLAQALDDELRALAAPSERRRLGALLAAQAHRLVHWRHGGRTVNYRRFFNIADLAALRVEDDTVFARTHALILDLVAANVVDGLRIDHVDGLRDPAGYLERLRAATAAARPARPTPIWVEKILCGDERLRAAWPVAGTTGYEFANVLEAALIDPDGAAHIEAWYRRRTVGGPRRLDFPTLVAGAKRRVLGTWLAADVRRLARGLPEVLTHTGGPDDATARDVERALVETIVALPVYRTYVGPDGASDPTDRRLIAEAARGAAAAGRARPDVVDAIARLLTGAVAPADAGHARDFAAAFQQLSSPAMAKGFEDTALYAFVPLASRNEVGGDPATSLDGAPARLHDANAERAALWPDSLLATSTHDTKRSADMRARLDTLAEQPETWTRAVARWRRRNRPFRTRVGRRLVPDDNTEYLLYQSMVGIWPGHAPAAHERDELRARLAPYAVKAVREAKVHTSWLAPHPAFEAAVLRFLDAVLDDDEFVATFTGFVAPIAAAGRWNALARTLVHLTAPGIPDLYQGDELWNLALADPDNRRPVDFALRDGLLAELEAEGVPTPSPTVADDAVLKLHVVRTALRLRQDAPVPFARGAYEPLTATGTHAAHVLAFVRRHDVDAVVTVVPRLPHALAAGAPPVGGAVWADTALALPTSAGRTLLDVVSGGRHVVPNDGLVPLATLLATFPVALLREDR